MARLSFHMPTSSSPLCGLAGWGSGMTQLKIRTQPWGIDLLLSKLSKGKRKIREQRLHGPGLRAPVRQMRASQGLSSFGSWALHPLCRGPCLTSCQLLGGGFE